MITYQKRFILIISILTMCPPSPKGKDAGLDNVMASNRFYMCCAWLSCTVYNYACLLFALLVGLLGWILYSNRFVLIELLLCADPSLSLSLLELSLRTYIPPFPCTLSFPLSSYGRNSVFPAFSWSALIQIWTF
jgi:hypothetical protein